MGMFRFTSWITDSTACDKAVNSQFDDKMVHAGGTRPVVEITPAKRKRSESLGHSEPTRDSSPSAKRPKPLSSHTAAPPAKSDVEANRSTKKAVDVNLVKDTIKSQFSLEILLKHNELRLIDQELAKCQVALEQLRRCHLIPYPAVEGSPESMLLVSNGTGPALSQKDHVPRWAPPFGVTDGPYSRHYSRWLIPDPSFDGIQPEWHEGARAGKTVPEGRSTRNSFAAEGRTPATKSRSQRTSGAQLQALPNGYPQEKARAGPCVLRRPDGQMVKLVCLDCNRENFSSTQGFINHCRIAHRRDFKSHEEAASQSGQPIETDEAGAVIGEEKPAAPSNGLVHPLIRTASTDRAAIKSILERIKEARETFSQESLQITPQITTSAPPPAQPHASFIPSTETPHLSELMRRSGFGGDLDQIVDDAKTKVDFEENESEDEGDEEADMSPTAVASSARLDGTAEMSPIRARMPPTSLGRPGSAKGMPEISPRLSHAMPVVNHNAGKPSRLIPPRELLPNDMDVEIVSPTVHELSPHTVASNNAPSLVSDDGEYDEHDVDSEGSEAEEEGSDVAEIDIEDEIIPPAVLRNRAGSQSEGMRLRKEEKERHVTFVSPVKEAAKQGRPRRA